MRIAAVLVIFLGLCLIFPKYTLAQGLGTLETEVTVNAVRKTDQAYALSVRVGLEDRHPQSGRINITYGDGTNHDSGQIPLTNDQRFFSYTFPETNTLDKADIQVSLVENGIEYKGRTQTLVVTPSSEGESFVKSWETDLILEWPEAPAGCLITITPGNLTLATSGVGVVVTPSNSTDQNWRRVTNVFEIAGDNHPGLGLSCPGLLKMYIKVPEETESRPEYRLSRQNSFSENYPTEIFTGQRVSDYYLVTLDSMQGGYSLYKRDAALVPSTVTIKGQLISSLDQSPVSGRTVTVQNLGEVSCDRKVSWPPASALGTTQKDGSWQITGLQPGWVVLTYWDPATEPPTPFGSDCLLLDIAEKQTSYSVGVYTKPYLKLLPPANSVLAGQEFDIFLQVNTLGYEDLSSAYLSLEFDTARLEFVDIRTDYGVIDFGTSKDFINQTGKIFFSSTLPEGMGESFTPARFVFRAKGGIQSVTQTSLVVTRNTVELPDHSTYELGDPNAKTYTVVLRPN